MELQGPEQFHDPFAKDILRFNRGGIVSIDLLGTKSILLMTYRLYLPATTASRAF